MQGHSAVLNLDLRWERGQLGLYIPATGRHIATLAGERARADRSEAQARTERARADREQAARTQAEARVRELEEMLCQLHNP